MGYNYCNNQVGGVGDYYCDRGRVRGTNTNNFALLVVMFILLIIVGANVNFGGSKGRGRC